MQGQRIAEDWRQGLLNGDYVEWRENMNGQFARCLNEVTAVGNSPLATVGRTLGWKTFALGAAAGRFSRKTHAETVERREEQYRAHHCHNEGTERQAHLKPE